MLRCNKGFHQICCQFHMKMRLLPLIPISICDRDTLLNSGLPYCFWMMDRSKKSMRNLSTHLNQIIQRRCCHWMALATKAALAVHHYCNDSQGCDEYCSSLRIPFFDRCKFSFSRGEKIFIMWSTLLFFSCVVSCCLVANYICRWRSTPCTKQHLA